MRFYSLLTLFAFSLLITACGGEAPADSKMEEDAPKAETTMVEDAPTTATINGVTLSPMPDTKGFPDAKLTDWTYVDGTFNYAVENYEFAAQTPDAESLMCANSGKGQHAHLIIDNEPYMAKYTPEFDVDIADGPHYILTFLSRSYHEAIKNGSAHRAVKTEIKDNSFGFSEDVELPMLFYSRPKGTYKGKVATEKVMLDFYPINTTLGSDDYYVEASVNGAEPFKITNWQPYFLTGLPMGENTVKLSLMKDGELVDAPLNPVSRTFSLEALPTGE
jgi:hypothetical protein